MHRTAGVLSVLVVLLAVLLVGGGCGSRPYPPAVSPAVTPPVSGCAPVEVMFARGTGQPPGLGRIGDAFARAVIAGLPAGTVRTRGVDYPAGADQDVRPGVVDLVDHARATLAACPDTARLGSSSPSHRRPRPWVASHERCKRSGVEILSLG